MGIGLLFINNGHHDMYLPIFNEKRELVLSVLTDAVKKWGEPDRKSQERDSIDFYQIADALGRQRSGSHLFLGAEAVSPQCLGGVESACEDALFIFAVDFEKRKIIALK